MKDSSPPPGDPLIACMYTQHQWSWKDDDGNGQLDWVRRIDESGSALDIIEMWESGWFHHFTTSSHFAAHVSDPGWTVFGLRSPPSADYDLYLYGDNNLTYGYASSEWGGEEVDFIVGDYHLNRTGIEHLQADRYSGSSDRYNIVWEGGGEEIERFVAVALSDEAFPI